MFKRALLFVFIFSLFLSFSIGPMASAQEEVVFWSTDDHPDRVARYEKVAEEFMEENPDVNVKIVPVDESALSQKIAAARAAGNLPDMARLGVERVFNFATEGLLDEKAAQQVISRIGEGKFRGRTLEMVKNPETGSYAALPYDGWIQGLWYRSDVFQDLALTPPTSWADINSAVDTLPGEHGLDYAMTLGTKPGETSPHQWFEQVAISNDAWPFDREGNVTMNSQKMVEALDFYTSLQRGAVPGPQAHDTGLETYQAGQTGMSWYSTYIMDDLVQATADVDISVNNLADKTAFASKMVGPRGTATYGTLIALGIFEDASPATTEVAEYFLQDGYLDILELSPFGKVPVLEGKIEGWKKLSPAFKEIPDPTLNEIVNGYENIQRWVLKPEYGPSEKAVIGEMEGRKLIPQALSRIAIEETWTPKEAANWLQDRVEELMAEQQ